MTTGLATVRITTEAARLGTITKVAATPEGLRRTIGATDAATLATGRETARCRILEGLGRTTFDATDAAGLATWRDFVPRRILAGTAEEADFPEGKTIRAAYAVDSVTTRERARKTAAAEAAEVRDRRANVAWLVPRTCATAVGKSVTGRETAPSRTRDRNRKKIVEAQNQKTSAEAAARKVTGRETVRNRRRTTRRRRKKAMMRRRRRWKTRRRSPTPTPTPRKGPTRRESERDSSREM